LCSKTALKIPMEITAWMLLLTPICRPSFKGLGIPWLSNNTKCPCL
jgi:hypothetical protein